MSIDPVLDPKAFAEACAAYPGPESCYITHLSPVTHFDLDKTDFYRGPGFYGCIKEFNRAAVWYGPFDNEVAAKDWMPRRTPTHQP